MLNVDGSVSGNTVNTFTGKDLNKLFGKKKNNMSPEIELVTNL